MGSKTGSSAWSTAWHDEVVAEVSKFISVHCNVHPARRDRTCRLYDRFKRVTGNRSISHRMFSIALTHQPGGLFRFFRSHGVRYIGGLELRPSVPEDDLPFVLP